MKRSKLLTVLLAALLVLVVLPVAAQEEGSPPQVGLRADAPPYAVHGPYWVGVTQLEAETPHHPTKIMVWYPALNPDGAEEITTYDYDYDPDLGVMPIAGRALKDAAPDASGEPYPLVLYVHGWQGDRYGAVWLGEHLASHGFVVMSMDQIENAAIPGIFQRSLFYRPQEVSWQLDYADTLANSDGKFAGLMDMDLIAVVGHSFGGYTALMAGGAQIDWSYFDTWCGQNYERAHSPGLGGENFCDSLGSTRWSLASLAGLDASQAGAWPSWGDPRIDAIIPMAPAFGILYGPEGLKNIRVPFLLLAGSGDNVVVPPDWSDLLYEDVGSTEKGLVVFENANHALFSFNCEIAPWMPFDSQVWCSDPVWDMDRAHDLSNHFTTAFLLGVLKGDEDAHIALAPEGINFPGVIYEAQGF